MITVTPEYLAQQGFSADFLQRFWDKVNKNGPIPKHRPDLGNCWVWIAATYDKDGYGQIRPGGSKNCVRAHRAGFIIQNGPVPSGLWVLHHCDNRTCVRGSHLWCGTPQENMRDCYNKGRQASNHLHFEYHYAEEHFRTRLTWQQVDSIRVRYWTRQASIRQLADEHHYSYQGILAIVKGDVWPISAFNRLSTVSPHFGTCCQ